MRHDQVVDGEALAAVEGETDVTRLVGSAVVINLHDEPQRAAFNAFRANETDPCLRHAKALVRAWNAFADVMGLDHE